MVKFENNILEISEELIKKFDFRIRSIVEIDDIIVVLLEIPFNNSIEKNNIFALDYQGNIVWNIDNSQYVKNTMPFEQIFFKDGYIYASDFYARRVKINYKNGKIEDVIISK